MESLSQIEFWHWWIAAAVLIGIEMLAPGIFFLWMGIAAGLIGLLLLVAPQVSWQIQMLLFAIVSVGAIVAWRAYLKKHPTVTALPNLNRRGAQYVGRTFTLEAPIVNGKGKIKVDDTLWRVKGADLAAGTKVKVVSCEGTVLRIEADNVQPQAQHS